MARLSKLPLFFCVSQQGGSRGAAKIFLDGPPAHLINPRPTHLPSDFFPLIVFISGASRQGELKNTTQMFLQKVHVENFSKKIKKIDVSFSSIFVCFIAFSGVSQRWEFKNTTKNVLQKNRVSVHRVVCIEPNCFYTKPCRAHTRSSW
jgi:hypothetical protein